MPFSHVFRPALVAVAVTAAVGLSPAAAGAAVVASPSDIPADCSVDVTARLQAAINAAPDGSTLQLPAAACYRVDGTLVVKAKTNLTIDGRGTTIRVPVDHPAIDHRNRLSDAARKIASRHLRFFSKKPKAI